MKLLPLPLSQRSRKSLPLPQPVPEVQEVPAPLTIPIINEPEGSNEPHGRPCPGCRGPSQQLEGVMINFADFSKRRRQGSRPGSSERLSGESEEEEELTRKVPSGGLMLTTPVMLTYFSCADIIEDNQHLFSPPLGNASQEKELPDAMIASAATAVSHI